MIHYYELPPLDYESEDVSIEFNVIVKTGARPLLFAQICNETTIT